MLIGASVIGGILKLDDVNTVSTFMAKESILEGLPGCASLRYTWVISQSNTFPMTSCIMLPAAELWNLFGYKRVYKVCSENTERYGMTYVQRTMKLSRTQLGTEITERAGVVEIYSIMNDKKPNKNGLVVYSLF